MVNKVTIMGNLTRDPELKTLSSGTTVTDVGVALNRKFTSNGQKKEETTFVDVTFWGKQAEVICQYAKKGRTLYIEGRLALDSWEDHDGNKKSKLKVTGEDFQFVGGRSEESDGEANVKNSKPQKPNKPVVEDIEDDEEIPF